MLVYSDCLFAVVNRPSKAAKRTFGEDSLPHLVLVTKNHILSAVQAPVGANWIFCDPHPSAQPLALTGAHKCPIEKNPQLLLQQHLSLPSARLRFRRSGAQATAELM